MRYNWQHRTPCEPASHGAGTSLCIMHIALQGCIAGGGIRYGLTADTGGHIRYLMEEVAALQEAGCQQIVVTRAFDDARLGRQYAVPSEMLMPSVPLYRLQGATDRYLTKEQMHDDLNALGDALLTLLERLPIRPDLIHAHYADAGVLALRVKCCLDIPYVFTAHSLGAVKARCTDRRLAKSVDPIAAQLARRIETEQAVIDNADRLIASSANEAKEQYGLYRRGETSALPVVNPPGVERARFANATVSAAIPGVLKRFLADPDKPMLLCVARPVHKKNLAGVLDAYAADPSLQARANLVILAGRRDAMAEQERECRMVWRALLDRIECHDLYGTVALPKQHEPDDVPGWYRCAAETGGLFVNAAFNEPFGLTYIEAAAAGLPILASRFGGGAEIVARCRNGQLIDPFNPASIATAAHALLDDRAAWKACAENGTTRVAYYSWRRHARQYLRDCQSLRAAVAEAG